MMNGTNKWMNGQRNSVTSDQRRRRCLCTTTHLGKGAQKRERKSMVFDRTITKKHDYIFVFLEKRPYLGVWGSKRGMIKDHTFLFFMCAPFPNSSHSS